MTWIAVAVVLLALAAAAAALLLDNLAAATAAASVVSLGVAVMFVMLHAPDVAMTEAVIGAGLSGMILALALRRIGRATLDGSTSDDRRQRP
jgi:uncharacterized MnhB-related membrane protein